MRGSWRRKMATENSDGNLRLGADGLVGSFVASAQLFNVFEDGDQRRDQEEDDHAGKDDACREANSHGY